MLPVPTFGSFYLGSLVPIAARPHSSSACASSSSSAAAAGKGSSAQGIERKGARAATAIFLKQVLSGVCRKKMLARPASLLVAAGFFSRALAVTTIKFDISRPRFTFPAEPRTPASFSPACTATKLLELQCRYGRLQRGLPAAAARCLAPVILSIASKCAKFGDSALIELPCNSVIADAIAESPLQLSTLGSPPDWSIDAAQIVRTATPRTSLIALQSVNVATGYTRPPKFFSSLLLQLHANIPGRRTILLVDDTYYVKRDAAPCDTVADAAIVFVADAGATIGAPDICCVVSGSDSALYAAAHDSALQPSSAAVVDKLSAPAAAASNILLKNAALFSEWMHRETERLRWSTTSTNSPLACSLVSLAPGVALDARRFYSELERRGATRVGRGSEWSVDDSSFIVAWGHVDSDVLKHGLQAVSSALDVWASTDSDLGLRSIY
jgi:hypothetical protein